MLFNSGLGVDIRSDQVNIVYLKGSFKGVRVAAETHSSLDTTKSPNERIKDAADFINMFIKEHHISAAGIFVGIPGETAISRVIELPLAVKENLRATLQYEMEKYIPLSVEDIYFDYQIISENKETEKLKVLLEVVRKKDFDSYIQLANFLIKGISGIEILSSAVSNYYFNHKDISDEPSILAYFCNNDVDIMLTSHQAMIYTRSFHQTENGMDQESVRGQLVKVKSMFVEQDKQVRLTLFGLRDNADNDEWTSKLSDDGFDVFQIEKTDNSVSDDRYIPAFGLALRGIKKVPVNMNMLPLHLRTKPDRTSYFILTILVALLIVSALVWAGSHVITQRLEISRLNTELDRLRSEAASVQKEKDKVSVAESRVNYLESFISGNIHVVDIMKELTEIIPETAWIKEFKLSKNEISIYGEAVSASELIPLLETSPLFENVKFLSTIRKARDDKEVFRIGMTIQGGQG